jgi:hypothetical protein
MLLHAKHDILSCWKIGLYKICIFELDCILSDRLMSLLAQGFQAQLIF